MESNKRNLSARQIINRYKKGVYVDECADAISAAVSASDAEFEYVAIPIQKHWIEDVFENIDLCIQLSKEQDKADDILAGVSDERIRSLLLDLSTPDLWNAIMGDGNYIDIIFSHGLRNKYQLPNAVKIICAASYIERERLESLGIDRANLELALRFIVAEPKTERQGNGN